MSTSPSVVILLSYRDSVLSKYTLLKVKCHDVYNLLKIVQEMGHLGGSVG